MVELIKSLITQEENLFLEFKSKWYWENRDANLSKVWGEFLKDFVALINCHPSHIEEDKYLIIGVDEEKIGLDRAKDITFDANNEEITKLKDLDFFKEEILSKLNNNFKTESSDEISNIDFTISNVIIDHKKLLVFTIKPMTDVLILKKELQDKKTTTRKNVVFIRTLKADNRPEVAIAEPNILTELKELTNKYREKKESEIKKSISIEKTVNLFVQNNNSFSLDTPQKKRDWNDYIQYEFYPVKSNIIDIDFIYIFDKSSQQKTYDYLISESILTVNAKKIILIDKHLSKVNIKKIFSAEEVYTIEEYGYKNLYNGYFDTNIFHQGSFNIKSFVEPFAKNRKEITAYITLNEWYQELSNPLIVIKGYGGVGKTTLVKYFLDKVIDSAKEDTNVLFINSKEILNDIVRYDGIDDVFHFYEVLAHKRKIDKVFDKKLLELSVDNGNLLIVLDGIDEVIAKAGSKFNIEKFISSIYENYSSGLDQTKIIITCRDYFWDNNHNVDYINTIELKPFNLAMAESFFKSKFDFKSKEYKKSLILAEEFALSTSSNKESIYIPYILDLIADIVLKDKEFGVNTTYDLDSKVLSKNIINDYLVGRVCEREISKLQTGHIDDQVNLFICLAVKYNGAINVNSIEKLGYCTSAFTSSLITKFKGHPILTVYGETLSFRYDFFTEYFKNIYIGKFFLEENIENIDNDFIEIMGDNIRYDNSFTKNICKRIDFNDELKLFIIEIIEKIHNDEKYNEPKKRKLNSSLLILLLVALRMSEKLDNVENRTELVKEIFGTERIDNLSIINLLVGENNVHPTLDFSDIELVNCWFENYDFFWECKMNANTYFRSSTFKQLSPRKGIRAKIISGMFDEHCDITDIEYLITTQIENDKVKTDKVKTEVVRVINYFEQGGSFIYRKIADVRSKFNVQILEVLTKNKIIQTHVNPNKSAMGKQYRINPKYNDLVKTVDQGGTYIELERVLSLFKSK